MFRMDVGEYVLGKLLPAPLLQDMICWTEANRYSLEVFLLG